MRTHAWHQQHGLGTGLGTLLVVADGRRWMGGHPACARSSLCAHLFAVARLGRCTWMTDVFSSERRASGCVRERMRRCTHAPCRAHMGRRIRRRMRAHTRCMFNMIEALNADAVARARLHARPHARARVRKWLAGSSSPARSSTARIDSSDDVADVRFALLSVPPSPATPPVTHFSALGEREASRGTCLRGNGVPSWAQLLPRNRSATLWRRRRQRRGGAQRTSRCVAAVGLAPRGGRARLR